jgi:hypothetical protein
MTDERGKRIIFQLAYLRAALVQSWLTGQWSVINAWSNISLFERHSSFIVQRRLFTTEKPSEVINLHNSNISLSLAHFSSFFSLI